MTDPNKDTLDVFEADVDKPKKITDPKFLAELNAPAPQKITDPALLKELNGDSPSAPEQPGFFDRVGTDMTNRANEGADAIVAYKNNEQGLGQTALQLAGKMGAGATGDIIGEAGKSVASATPDFIKNALSSMGKTTLEQNPGLNRFLTAAGEGATQVKEAYEPYAKKNPNAARSIESVGDLANMLLGSKVTGAAAAPVTKGISTGAKAAASGAKATAAGVKNVAKGAGEGIENMKLGYNARSPEALEGAIKGMEGKAQQQFSTMKGVGIRPDLTTKIFDHIDKTVREDREIDPDLHADYVRSIDRMKEKAKNGMTLQQLHLQRQLLRDVETKNFLNNKPVAAVARKAIDAMDEALETTKIKGGSKEGASAIQGMQNGIATWAQARKFESIANVIQRAQGDPNKLKSGFTTLLNNKKQMRGFTKEEIAAIRKASENTTGESLMKMLGKFGFDISSARSGGNAVPWLAGFGAHLAGASTPELGGLAAIGTGAKYGQKLMARGKAENVLKQIENRKVNGVPPVPPNPMGNFNNFLKANP